MKKKDPVQTLDRLISIPELPEDQEERGTS